MIDNIFIKINGNDYNGNPIRVLPNGFIISWKYLPEAVVQTGFQMQIGSSSFALGTDEFVGDIFSITQEKSSQSYSFSPNTNLIRSSEVYGQIRIKDQFNNYSIWKIFKSYINDLPNITSVSIDSSSNINNGIKLSILKSNDTLYKVRWYQNGKLQSYLDDTLNVPSRNIEYGDIWYAQVIPYDELENGYSVVTSAIEIEKPIISGSNAEIIPTIPNPDDILEVKYNLVKNGSIENLGDESYIRWYVNDIEVQGNNGTKYARLDMKPGDRIYARVETSWSGFSGQTIFTNTVTVGNYNLQLSNLAINGANESGGVSYDAVSAIWNIPDVIKNNVSRFSFKLGHSEGGDSVFSTILPANTFNFFIPPDKLKKGMDYYLSVAPIDFQNNTGRYETIYFKTFGNIWNDNVISSVGYTLLLNIKCEPIETGQTPLDVISLNVSDGRYAFSIDFYTNFVRVNIDSQTKIKSQVDNSYFRTYIISVKNSQIIVYVDGEIIINYNSLNQLSNAKYLNLVPRGGSGDLKSTVSYIRIGSNGAYHENEENISELISFSEIIDLPNAIINDIENTPNGILVAAKDISTNYSKIYSYNPGNNEYKIPVESISENIFYLSQVNSSPSNECFVVSTNKGVSLFKGDPIVDWDSSSSFNSFYELYSNNWITYSSTESGGISFSADGLLISNSFSNVGRSSSIKRNNQLEYASISIKQVFNNEYAFQISEGYFRAYSTAETTTLISHEVNLSNYTVSQLVSYIKELPVTEDGTLFIRNFYEFDILNGSGDEAASNLIDFLTFDTNVNEHILYIENVSESIDPYADAFQTSYSGGKSYIVQDSIGSIWHDSASSDTGYSIELDLKVTNLEDSFRPIETFKNDIFGMYINDGKFDQEIQFLADGIFVNRIGKRFNFDLSDFTKLRFNSQNGKMQIWKKSATDRDYSLLGNVSLNNVPIMSRNVKQYVSYFRNNVYYFAWIENDGDFDVVNYVTSKENNSWSDIKSIPIYNKSIKNIDIAIDQNDVLYLAYETFAFDHSDIFVISKNKYGWSTQFNVTNDRGSSKQPKLFVDEFNNLHVIWCDSRSGVFEIMHSYFDGYARAWVYNGSSAQIVSSSNYGAHSPSITGYNGNLFVSWTENSPNGGSQIKISRYQIYNNKWYGKNGLSIDPIVSNNVPTKADKSDILADKEGNIHIVYHDFIDQNYKIYHRVCSSELNFFEDPKLVTSINELTDSIMPKIGLVDSNGDILLSFIKTNRYRNILINGPELSLTNLDIVNFDQDAVQFDAALNGVYLCKWSRAYRAWLSSGSIISTSSGTLGGFDSKLDIKNINDLNTSCFPKIIPSNSYASILIRDLDYGGINRIYVFEIDTQLSSNILSFDNLDPYGYSLTVLNSIGPKKSILIGDASNYISGDIHIKSINYSVSGKKNPFIFRKIGYLTHLISSDPIIKSFVSDDGDCWMVNSKGFYYYDFNIDQVANSWSSELFDNNNLGNIIGINVEYRIKDCFIDFFGNFYATVQLDSSIKILVSIDHTRWFELKFSDIYFNPDNNIKLSFNKKGDMLVSQIGKTLIVKNYVKEFRDKITNSSLDLITSSSSSGNKFEVILEVSESINAPLISGITTINEIGIDEESKIFICTDLGLYFGKINNLVLLGMEDGLPSNIIKSISIIDNYSRLCTFDNSISYMNGSVFEDVSFTGSYPISTENGIIFSNQTNYKTNYGKLINSIKYGNYILVCAKNGLVIRLDSDPILSRRLPKSVFFNSEVLDIINPESARNLISKEIKFNLPENLKQDPNLNSYLVEVYLNGNIINRGYEFSAKEQIIYFLTSLLPNDIIKIKLRPDFKIENDFSQNGAEKIAFGTQSRNIRMISYNYGQSYGIITGDSDYVAVKDSGIELPYDEVVLDREPPSGKVKFISQTGPDSIVLGIDQLQDGQNQIPYDEVSGIASMIISNYDNFTSDGTTPIDPVPFSPVVAHDLIASLNNNTLIKESLNDNFSKIFTFTVPGSVEKTYIATSAPINIYERSTSGVVSEFPIITLEDGSDDYEISFAEKMGNNIIIGTRSIRGLNSGKLLKSNDLQIFDVVSILPGSGANCAFMSAFDQNMYIGIDGSLSTDPNGVIVRYNGNETSTYKTRLDKSVSSLTGFDRFLYAGTYDGGVIYRIDLASNSVEIMHVSNSEEVMSLSVLGASIFAGLSNNGTIIRAKNNDAGFIQSFRTTPSNVSVLKTLKLSDNSNVIFAGVGNKVYSFRNTWTLEGSSEYPITDFIVDENGAVIYSSFHQIKSVQSSSGSARKVFVKLIDNAGNETDIRSAPDEPPTDGYNDNLTLTLTSAELSSTYLQSKLLEVDDNGTIGYRIDGDAPFYSAERIIRETGVYYSDVFNGTTGHVSWDKLNWQGNFPEGTFLKIYVRVSDSKLDIESSNYSYEIDQTQNNVDISFLSGQYLQLKIVMSSITEITPYISKIVVTNNAGSASHFFTNTFPLPAKIKRGIITTEKSVPSGSDIIIGITGTDAIDFSQYQIIPENRIFSLEDNVQGEKLRVGFRFITPQSAGSIAEGEDVGTTSLGTILSNSVQFDFLNSSGSNREVDFKVEFFEDSNLNVKKSEFDSLSSPQLFRINGNPFPSGGGVSVPSGFNYRIHFIPFGAELSCDFTYYVKITLIENNIFSMFGNVIPFKKICNVNYINNIVFTYINRQSSVQKLHFDIAFYEDELRTSLVKSINSQSNLVGYRFLADFFDYSRSGLVLEPNQSSVISLEMNAATLSEFEQDKTYYVTISYFDLNQSELVRSVESMNFTFKSLFADTSSSCGASVGTPVLQGFSFMFELEDGRIIKFNYLT